MYIYFLLIRIAALFGHKKAQKLVQGEAQTLKDLTSKTGTPDLKGCIWFHAASSGEFEQARPLIERFKKEHPNRKIVVTFFSPSGFELRKNYQLADKIFYLPFATRRNAKRFIAALHPEMAVFVKYEFWPAYIRELCKKNIPVYSICSIFRPRQIFFRWWGKGQRNLLKAMTHLYVQDEDSRRLLAEHGVHNASVAGDTRFDRVIRIMEDSLTQTDSRLTPIEQFTGGCERVIVAGSTWPEDEKLLEKYIADFDNETVSDRKPVKLILVPHETDPEHLHFIFNLFKGRFIRYSTMLQSDFTPSIEGIGCEKYMPSVMVIDTVGLLSRIYRLGHAAYVGGGFGVGIHNTIEPAAMGLPVIFGPEYKRFREAQGLIDAGAARSVRNAQELQQALDYALDHRNDMGDKAAQYVRSEQGATAIIYRALLKIPRFS